MQFIDLQQQYLQIKSQIQTRINCVLDHGQYILGPEVKEVEKRLAAYVDAKYCITVANGTDALMIAMMALGIQPGDEVITSPFSFIANGETIALLGATPVFVDINPNTYNIAPELIARAITNKTRCIMPISLFGQCADMDAINRIATEYNIPVIEDAAQSFGANYKDKKSCNLSAIACTSFFPSKPLGCYGDGGACFTNDATLAEAMQQIRTHGQKERYHHHIVGVNSRLDTLQAAVLLAKLDIFDEEVAARQRIANKYHTQLAGHVKTMHVPADNTCVYAQYTIEVPERERVRKFLQDAKIPTAIHYPLPLNMQPVFTTGKNTQGTYPCAETAAKSVMSLPMHPYLDEATQDYICNQLILALTANA